MSDKASKIFECEKQFYKVEQPDGHIRMVRVSNTTNVLKSGVTLSKEQQLKLLKGLMHIMGKDDEKKVISAGAECISQLAASAADATLREIFTRLGRMLMDKSEGSLIKRGARDFAEICLLQCIDNVSDESGTVVTSSLLQYVIAGCRDKSDSELQQQSARVLLGLLKRFSAYLGKDQRDEVINCLWEQTMSDDEAVLSSLPDAIGHLAETSNEATLASTYEKLRNILSDASDKRDLKMVNLSLRILKFVVKSSTSTKGDFINTFSKLLFNIVDIDTTDEDEDDVLELTYEVRASTLEVFQSFLENYPIQTPIEIIDDIIAVCLKNAAFDPNISSATPVQDSEDEDDDDPFGGDDDLGFASDAEEGDVDMDEDNSWKVRKASADTIRSLVRARPEQLKNLYRRCCVTIIDRFSERVGVVTVAVLQCFEEMLKASLVIDQKHDEAIQMLGKFPAPPMLTRVASATDQLVTMVQSQLIVKKANAQLRDCAVDTKAAMFSMFQVFLIVIKKKKLLSLIETSHLKTLTEEVCDALDTPFGVGVSAMKIEALKLVENLCNVLEIGTLRPLIKKLLKSVCARFNKDEEDVVKERAFYTIKSVLDTPKLDVSDCAAKLTKIVSRVVTRKSSLQSLRLAAIAASGSLLAVLGNHADVAGSIDAIVQAHLARMDKDVFVAPVLRAFRRIASSTTPVEAVESFITTLEEKIIAGASKEFASRQAMLQLERLQTLTVLAKAYKSKTKIVSDPKLIMRFADLISESTVTMAQAILELAVVVQQFHDEATDGLVMNALKLVCSNLVVAGGSSSSLFNLLQRFVRTQVKGKYTSFEMLLDACWHLHTTPKTSKNLASIVSLCAADAGSDCGNYVESIIEKTKDKSPDIRATAVNILGALGSKMDITSKAVLECILQAAKDDAALEDIASHAYGGIAYGSLDAMLPTLVKDASDSKKAGFALGAVREILSIDSTRKERKVTSKLLESMLKATPEHFRSSDEHVRSCAIDVCGLLVAAGSTSATSTMLLQLDSESDEESRNQVQSCVLRSLRSGIELLGNVPREFLDNLNTFVNLKSRDAKVACATVDLLRAIVVVDPMCVSKFLSENVKDLVAHLDVRKDLIVEVAMGVMKMKTDYGKNLRMATCHCLTAILRSKSLRILTAGDIIDELVEKANRDIRKSTDMELKENVVVSFEMLGVLLSRYGDRKYYEGKSGLIKRVSKTVQKLVKVKGSARKGDKVFLACSKFMSDISPTARGIKDYKELMDNTFTFSESGESK